MPQPRQSKSESQCAEHPQVTARMYGRCAHPDHPRRQDQLLISQSHCRNLEAEVARLRKALIPFTRWIGESE